MDDKCRADDKLILMPQFYERKEVEWKTLRFISLNNIREWPAVQNELGLGIASTITVSQGFPRFKVFIVQSVWGILNGKPAG